MKALGVGKGQGMCSGPGVWQALWGVLGLGRVGPVAQKALVMVGTVSGLGLRVK